VFQHASQLASGSLRVELTDAECETAHILRGFLSLAYSSHDTDLLGHSYHGMSEHLLHLFTFLRKWDCLAMAVLEGRIRDLVGAGLRDPVFAFAVAARAERYQLCVDILRLSQDQVWPSADCREGAGPVWDPPTWPLRFFGVCPRDLMWALGRAWAHRRAGGLHVVFERVVEQQRHGYAVASAADGFTMSVQVPERAIVPLIIGVPFVILAAIGMAV
jgi:hypothetical protein